jgi:hypothetical protein
LFHALLYRARQFSRAVGSRPEPADVEWACDVLGPQMALLFRAMSPRDQAHSLGTLRLLRPDQQQDSDLVVAALLHDAGKGYIRLHERVLFVLLSPFPALLRLLAHPSAHGWRSALHRCRTHAEAGALLAAAAGASDRTVELIRRHHHHRRAGAMDPALASLIDADDRA